MKTGLVLLLLAGLVGAGEARGECLRVMPLDELVGNSLLIARGHVHEVDESEWGANRQVAELHLDEVIFGDTTLKQVHVGTKSLMACATDDLDEDDQVLLFLARDGGLYQTVNFQYGQFRVEGDVVRHWRRADGTVGDVGLSDVRAEIRGLVESMNTPSTAPAPTMNKPARVPENRDPGAAAPATQGQPPGRRAGKPVRSQKLNPDDQ
jgi:hypothetical protein